MEKEQSLHDSHSLSAYRHSVASANPSSAQNAIPHDTATRVKALIEQQLASNNFPGIQYVVLNADSPLFSYAGGLTDVAAAKPILDSTTMMAYSMTKTITAAAVLQLVEQGKVLLDDPITNYLMEIPYGNEVTLRHLLSQTSGIPNPIPLRWVHPAEEHYRFDERAALRRILAENAELKFTPGEKYSYANISYWLLGYVIENVSGMPYTDYLRENVFRRLSIPAREIDFVIPSSENHAKGYLRRRSFLNLFKSFVIDNEFIGEYEDGWLHIKNHYLNGPSFGGIVASARALGIFLQDQLRKQPKLFTIQSKRLFYEQQKNSNGEPIEMTLGWHIGWNDDVPYYFKGGGGGGFHGEMRVYLSRGIASVVIANNTSFDAKGFLNSADREFLHE